MSKPFETTFATLRRGAASMEATEAMQQVVKSVYETGKPAKLVIELTVKPNAKNGGMIEAVIVTDKITTKISQEAGQSVSVCSKMELVSNLDRQGDLFPEIGKADRAPIDIDDDGVIHHPTN